MMRRLLLFAVALMPLYAAAQEHGFEFGKILNQELDMKVYPKDTSAVVVTLKEFGEAHLNSSFLLVFTYHVKLKILKPGGIEKANVEIPLRKGDKPEIVRSIRASSFNRSSGGWTESQLDKKNIFTENLKYYDLKKFAIPNVNVGSVIEYSYEIESPFVFNFRNWYFQDDHPKIASEYWASIPGIYIYNMSLRGFLKLSKNESELVKDGFTSDGGNHADCGLYKFAMKDIPAMVEEEYMTAKSNFLASINFELSEIRYFDGRVDKVTKEWRDAEEELKKHEKFGTQLKRGKDIVEDHVASIMTTQQDELAKAQNIYAFIQSWFQWNEEFGMLSETGIKKAFTNRSGNVADINLSLIASLRYAGLNADPVILSTRANGLPIEIHPVLSDFNYVIAKTTIAGKTYLLDATDDFLTFGMIPERCINGKGRAIGNKESHWVELKPEDKRKQLTALTLKLEKDGRIVGTVENRYFGYEALNQRKQIAGAGGEQEYITYLRNKHSNMVIGNFVLKNGEDLSKPLEESFDVEIDASGYIQGGHLLFNPFLLEKWSSNPFKSAERLYPVDFGMPLEETVIVNLEYPEGFSIPDLPAPKGLSLPNAGGRYIYDIKTMGNKLILNSSLSISRTIYSSAEYHYLKELFNQVVAIQNTDIMLTGK